MCSLLQLFTALSFLLSQALALASDKQVYQECAKNLLILSNQKFHSLLELPTEVQQESFMDAPAKSWLFQKLNQKKASLGLKYDAHIEAARVLKKIDFTKISNERQLKQYADQLSEALYGKQNTLDPYFFKNTHQRRESRRLYKLRNQIVFDTLKDVWIISQANHKKFGIRNKLSKRLNAFVDSRLGHILLGLPLPTWRDTPIDPELKEKIALDGLEAHKQSLNKHYKWSEHQNFYNTFKNKILLALFVSLMVQDLPEHISSIQNEVDKQEKLQKEQNEQFVEQWIHLESDLEKSILNAKERILLNAYQEAYKEFEQKWGEPPTPQEADLIQKKIDESLKKTQ